MLEHRRMWSFAWLALVLVACGDSSGADDSDGNDSTDASQQIDAAQIDAVNADADIRLIDAAPLSCVPTTPMAPEGRCLWQVVTASFHTCALRTDGTVWCWGVNGDLGLLGNGTSTARETQPVQVSNLTDVVQLAAGLAHTCALTRDGTVWCWGQGTDGQVGNGLTDRPNPVPVQVVGPGDGHLAGIEEISALGTFTCAKRCDSTVWCWGRDTHWSLGDGTGSNSARPVQVANVTTATQVTAGDQNTCVRLADGTYQCLGFNTDGQVGNDSDPDDAAAVAEVTNVANITGPAIQAGTLHVCALDANGELQCWGWNNNGQLGNGTEGAAANARAPVKVSDLGVGVKAFSLAKHTCAIDAADTLYCWGDNQYGVLGVGDESPRAVPTKVSFGTVLEGTPLQISVGGFHSCASMDNDEVWCWGRNNQGQLGRGNTSTHETMAGHATAFVCTLPTS